LPYAPRMPHPRANHPRWTARRGREPHNVEWCLLGNGQPPSMSVATWTGPMRGIGAREPRAACARSGRPQGLPPAHSEAMVSSARVVAPPPLVVLVVVHSTDTRRGWSDTPEQDDVRAAGAVRRRPGVLNKRMRGAASPAHHLDPPRPVDSGSFQAVLRRTPRRARAVGSRGSLPGQVW